MEAPSQPGRIARIQERRGEPRRSGPGGGPTATEYWDGSLCWLTRCAGRGDSLGDEEEEEGKKGSKRNKVGPIPDVTQSKVWSGRDSLRV